MTVGCIPSRYLLSNAKGLTSGLDCKPLHFVGLTGAQPRLEAILHAVCSVKRMLFVVVCREPEVYSFCCEIATVIFIYVARKPMLMIGQFVVDISLPLVKLI